MLTKSRRAWLVATIGVVTIVAPSVWAAAQQAPAAPEKPEVAKAVQAPPARTPRPGDVTKVFVLHHVGSQGLAELLRVFPATITFPTYGPTPNDAIGVAAAPGVMAAIEETIKRLDAPRAPTKSVELTGYVVESLAQPVESAPIPSDLEGVVAQLKRTFSYPAYRLLDTLIARGTDGSQLEATALSSNEQGPALRTEYKLRAQRVRVLTGEEGPTVRLENLAFQAQVPVSVGPNMSTTKTVGIQGDIEIRAGQRVVVGKSGSADPTRAMFLVLTAKVTD
jgi:hypothetical protein